MKHLKRYLMAVTMYASVFKTYCIIGKERKEDINKEECYERRKKVSNQYFELIEKNHFSVFRAFIIKMDEQFQKLSKKLHITKEKLLTLVSKIRKWGMVL